MLEYVIGVLVAIAMLTLYLIFCEKMITLKDVIKILGFGLLSWVIVVGFVLLLLICAIGIALESGENIVLWKKKDKR